MLSTVESMNTAIFLTNWEDSCIYAAPVPVQRKLQHMGVL